MIKLDDSGCDGCKHQSVWVNNHPCNDCKRVESNCADRYELAAHGLMLKEAIRILALHNLPCEYADSTLDAMALSDIDAACGCEYECIQDGVACWLALLKARVKNAETE